VEKKYRKLEYKMPYINKSKSICWGTPKNIKEKYEKYFDPCPFPKPEWNGLEITWMKKNFVNPPYDDLKSWTEKCMIEYQKGKEIVLLIPARTDTSYFHEYVLPFARIEFIKGRLKFIDLDNSCKKVVSAPFPSILCFYCINGALPPIVSFLPL